MATLRHGRFHSWSEVCSLQYVSAIPNNEKFQQITWFPPLAVFLISATRDFSFLSRFRISLSMSRSPERTALFASLAAAGSSA